MIQTSIFDKSNKQIKMMESIPKQQNGDDCGLAVCLNARAIVNMKENQTPSKDFDWGYELTNKSKYLRKKIATELVINQLFEN